MSDVNTKTEELEFDGKEAKDSKGSVVLGHLSGICADIINPTRNGRKYSDKLWEKVFNDPIVKEYFKCGGVFGELGHPADRSETDMEKIAICMPEPPQKNDKGQLVGKWDILDTPNGRILKTLCQYGYKMGISSRGEGETFTDYDGKESVDPDTYSFNAFDVVLLPAVETARLSFNESLNTSSKTLKQALAESLKKATPSEKKIMKETLDTLNIDYKTSKKKEEVVEEVVDEQAMVQRDAMNNCMDLSTKFIEHFDKVYKEKNVTAANHWINEMQNWLNQVNKIKLSNTNKPLSIDKKVDWFLTGGSDAETLFNDPAEAEAYNDFINKVVITNDVKQSLGLNEDIKDESLNINKEVVETEAVANDQAMVEELQTALKAKGELESKIIELQEKLSVCYAKEANLKEQVNKFKTACAKLSENARKSNALEEKLTKLNESLAEKDLLLNKNTSKIQFLEKQVKSNMSNRGSLQEQLNTKTSELTKANESINKLSEQYNLEKKSLTESIATLNKDLEIKKSEYSKKLENSNKMVEQYKKIATKAVDKYIDIQALRLGVTPNEIKNRLPESYTFNDIDSTCDDLRSYKLTMSKLPFASNSSRLQEGVKIAITSPKDSILPAKDIVDDVDDSLLRLAGLK